MDNECAVVNTDIAGIGVRVSFYVQTFFLVLLVDRSWRDAPIALWTFISTSFGLTIAAIIQAGANQLTFFQAVQVSYLVWLANFGTFLALATYSRKKAAIKAEKCQRLPNSHDVIKFFATAQTIFSMCLTISFWKNAATFNAKPDCFQQINLVLFAWNVPAKNRGRTTALILSSILFFAYVILTFLELLSYRNVRKDRQPRKDKNRQRNDELPANGTAACGLEMASLSAPDSVHTSPRNTRVSFVDQNGIFIGGREDNLVPQIDDSHHDARTSSPDTRPSSSPELRRLRDNRYGRRRWFTEVDPMLLGILTFKAFVWAFFVVSSELLIQRNPSHSNSDAAKWGFGQILALVLVVPSGMAASQALQTTGPSRVNRRNKADGGQPRRRRRKNRNGVETSPV